MPNLVDGDLASSKNAPEETSEPLSPKECGREPSSPSSAPRKKISGGTMSEETETTVAEKAGGLSLNVRYHTSTKVEDDYEITQKVLGSGLSGVVRLGFSKLHKSQRVAIKAFKLAALFGHKRSELEAELAVFLCMDHPHVSRLFDVYETKEYLHLVMECLDGGELFERVQKVQKFTEQDAADAVWQMLLALNYIHSHRVAHGDIKLENFIYDSEENNHLKLIDFGFSKIFHEDDPKKCTSMGTLAYMAPELIEKNFTSQCDMWSLGVIAFILLSGYMPFDQSLSQDAQIAAIRTCNYDNKPQKWKHVTPEAWDFTKSLMEVSPEKRLTAQLALDHTWIVNRHQKKNVVIDDDIVKGLVDFGRSSKFRRCCLSTMAWSLTNEDRAKVRNYFISMDTTQQGTITLAELRDVMNTSFEVPDEETRAVFEALDSNNDQEIHYSDFLAAMVSTRIDLHDDLLAQAFKRFDVDNSGFITAENLQEVLGETFEGTEVEELMKEADFVNDGRISFPEFVAYAKGATLCPKEQEAHVNKYDKMDRRSRLIDGMLSRKSGSETEFNKGMDKKNRISMTPEGNMKSQSASGRKQPCQGCCSLM
jgi:serine/threonine protein kinase